MSLVGIASAESYTACVNAFSFLLRKKKYKKINKSIKRFDAILMIILQTVSLVVVFYIVISIYEYSVNIPHSIHSVECI